jgi:hypothetical protein
MPGMTADKAIAMLWDAAIADHTQSSEPDGRRQAAEAAIYEAFEVRDRAREELARMEALARQNGGLPFASAERQIALVKRILGEEGSA